MRRARDVAEGVDEPAPIELQLGWMVDRYGVGLLGPAPDVKLIMRASKLSSIHKTFSRLATVGTKGMSPGEFAFIRDTMKEMS